MNHAPETLLKAVLQGHELSNDQAEMFAEYNNLPLLLATASQLRDLLHHNRISYSSKVFIPLTQLCRDVCHYCTFAQPPVRGQRAYLRRDEVLAIAQAGAQAGCKEALFTLGDKPERRYKVAVQELAEFGHETTLSYLAEMAEMVLRETGLLPHINPGMMTEQDIALLRRVSVSQGLMLETISTRLSARGGPHYGSPDKNPAVRLDTIRMAGEQRFLLPLVFLLGLAKRAWNASNHCLHCVPYIVNTAISRKSLSKTSVPSLTLAWLRLPSQIWMSCSGRLHLHASYLVPR